MAMRLCVVTATTNEEAAADCLLSWGDDACLVVIPNGGAYTVTPYLGVVPAFRLGVDRALQQFPTADVIACFHDDLEIRDPEWVRKVLEAFDQNPRMGLAGFGGAIGLGDDDLYQTDYRPEQLARKGFRSNLVDAEVHGMRSLRRERVACLDGFSQIGRREFWLGQGSLDSGHPAADAPKRNRPWTVLQDLGMIHHFYDGALGCLAARYGWETWYLPIACQHYGGRTAVGDRGYQDWAATQVAGGDHGFWREAHRIGYDAFRDVLPLRV